MARLASCAVVFSFGALLASCGSPSTTSPVTPTSAVLSTSDGTPFFVDQVAANLQVPWSLAFAPDGRLFFTERPGRVRVIANGALIPAPALTIDDVSANEESGVLGLALHPDFARTHYVYIA